MERSVNLTTSRLRNGALAAVLLVDALGLAAVAIRPWDRPDAFGAATADWLLLTHETNPSTWLTAALLLAVGGLALVALATASHAAERRFWLLTALVTCALSLDEVAAGHERMADVLRVDGTVGTYAWVLPGLVLASIVSAAFARGVVVLPPRTRRDLAVAGVVYLAGALGVEAIAGWWDSGHGNENMPYHLISFVEENLEFAGVVLAGTAILGHAAARRRSLTIRFG